MFKWFAPSGCGSTNGTNDVPREEGMWNVAEFWRYLGDGINPY